MNTPPLISILMPVKNAGDFLQPCLESILSQTEGNWELIAVNDHSNDGSGELLRSCGDARIKVIENEGQGIIPALRLALEASSGQLVTRMDADDLMAEGKLASMKRDLINSGPGHVALGLVEYICEGEGFRKYAEWLNGLTREGRNFEEIYKECVIPSPCWMVWREDLLKCGAFDSGRYPEDYDLCFRFRGGGLKCLPCSEVLHVWRDHPDRASRNDENYADNRFLDLKLDYFLKYESGGELVLWGAGKKGKFLAAALMNRGVDFRWVCNNEKKIGREIRGKLIEDCKVVNSIPSAQVIVAVAGDAQREISGNCLSFC